MSTKYDYGFTEAFLKANPEVAKKVAEAVAGNWQPSRFEAALKDTAWWKKTSDTARAAFTEQKTDPATWNRKVSERADQIAEWASAMGVPGLDAKALAARSLTWGWDESEIREQIGAAINWKTAGPGEASATVAELQDLARKNGVRVTEAWAQGQAKELLSGKKQGAQVEQQIRQWAANTFVQWKEQILAGENVEDLASPYLQAMAGILEVPEAEMNLVDDPTLRAALIGNTGEDGKAASMSLADFERSLRKDPRWQYTKNAQQTLGDMSRQVLQDFGLVS